MVMTACGSQRLNVKILVRPVVVYKDGLFSLRYASGFPTFLRIGQTRPVKVVFMSYRNTLQADTLKLVAKKM